MNCRFLNQTQQDDLLKSYNDLRTPKVGGIQEQRIPELNEYSFYFMVDFESSSIDHENDFLYIRNENDKLPEYMSEVDQNHK